MHKDFCKFSGFCDISASKNEKLFCLRIYHIDYMQFFVFMFLSYSELLLLIVNFLVDSFLFSYLQIQPRKFIIFRALCPDAGMLVILHVTTAGYYNYMHKTVDSRLKCLSLGTMSSQDIGDHGFPQISVI